MTQTRVVLTAVLVALALSGCQLYWQKPKADLAAFTTDHQACTKIAASPAGDGRVFVNIDMYRACLRSKGWQRETSSSMGTPPGYFRGHENPGPVDPLMVPEQTRVMEPARR
jgi:hypothetical protein